MNRDPGETAEQWNSRAAAQYQHALDALEVESRRLGLEGWQFAPGTYPTLDERYNQAMDALDAADDERIDATLALQREGPTAAAGPDPPPEPTP
jgi:hypothetical protein